MRSIPLVLIAVLAACGGQPAAPASTEPSASASAAPTTQGILPGDVVQIHAADGSSVTVRVREQLVRLPAPSEAVLVTKGVKGDLFMHPEGSFASGSQIVVDLTTLQSDSGLRDDFVKRMTLQTSRYPTATFTAKTANGLPVPFPSSGEWKVKLVGDLQIRSVTKEVTWDGSVKRDGAALRGTATTAFKFEDFGMQPPSAASVLSVVDEIKLQVDFVGTAG